MYGGQRIGADSVDCLSVSSPWYFKDCRVAKLLHVERISIFVSPICACKVLGFGFRRDIGTCLGLQDC